MTNDKQATQIGPTSKWYKQAMSKQTMSKRVVKKKVMGVCDKQEASAKEKGDGNIQQTRSKCWGKRWWEYPTNKKQALRK